MGASAPFSIMNTQVHDALLARGYELSETKCSGRNNYRSIYRKQQDGTAWQATAYWKQGNIGMIIGSKSSTLSFTQLLDYV